VPATWTDCRNRLSIPISLSNTRFRRCGPFGTRIVVDVTGGRCEGPRISGSFKGAGADWILIGPDGYGRLDVRGQIETDDGAFIYLQYFGLLHMNDNVQAAMAAGEGTEGTDFGDRYFYISFVGDQSVACSRGPRR
jgi:hypothetical protein